MTSDRKALLAAIIANPEEDTPRLVYADWLDEHGEEDRARLIRVRVALAGGQNTAGTTSTELLLHEENSLYNKFLPEWQRQHHMSAEDIPWMDRGQVYMIPANVDDERLAETLFEVRSTEPVSGIMLKNTKPGEQAARLGACLMNPSNQPVWNQLRCLGLSYPSITPDVFVELGKNAARFPHLQELEFSYYSPSDECVQELFRQLPKFPQLRRVDFSSMGRLRNRIVSLPDMPNLEWLDLSDHQFDGDGAAFVAQYLRRHPRLRRLDLGGNHYVDDAAAQELIQSLPQCPNLAHLDLSCIQLSPDAARELGNAVGQLPGLNHLSLIHCGLNSQSVQALLENPQNFKHIHLLDLRQNPLGGEGVKTLARNIGHFENLQELRLEGADVSAVGIAALARAAAHMPTLRSLSLDDKNVGAGGLRALGAHAAQFTNLRELSLGASFYNKRCIISFVRHAADFPKLESLKLLLDGSAALAEPLVTADFPHLVSLDIDMENAAFIHGLQTLRQQQIANPALPITYEKLALINNKPLSHYGIPTAEEVRAARACVSVTDVTATARNKPR